VGLERGPLSLVRITEDLLERKSSGSGSRKSRLTAVEIHCTDHATPSIPQKLALTSTGSGRSVGIVRLRIKATEFSFSFSYYMSDRYDVNGIMYEYYIKLFSNS
jgi:hypothetical protein